MFVVCGGLAFFLWTISRRSGPEATLSRTEPASIASPETSPSLSPSPELASATPGAPSPINPDTSASPQSTETPAGLSPAIGFAGTLKLIIPVQGVRPDQLLDTFTDARAEGRSHDAIDIPAAAGTSVLAASDGEVIKLFYSERGGTTIYQFTPDKKLVLYYAHLQGYAAGLAPGKYVKQGEVIGYVGDSGNAGVGNFHLHFSISIVPDPKRYWEGTNINPYPLLHK